MPACSMRFFLLSVFKGYQFRDKRVNQTWKQKVWITIENWTQETTFAPRSMDFETEGNAFECLNIDSKVYECCKNEIESILYQRIVTAGYGANCLCVFFTC